MKLVSLDSTITEKVDVISTGSFLVDMASGIGGFPRGRIVELFGFESTSKTTLAIHTVAQANKKKLRAAYIDAEHAFDREYAQSLGVDFSLTDFGQPDNGEEGLNAVIEACESGKYGVVVVDSVAALTPKAEIEGQVGDSVIGLHARLMSQTLRKLVGVANRTKTLVIFINQFRSKIGVIFGDPRVTTGGNALRFYASMRLEFNRTKENGNDLIKIKFVKNKLAPPFTKTETKVFYGKGISQSYELLQLALEQGIITKGGKWYKYNEEKAQGEAAALNIVEDNFEQIKKQVIAK